MRTIKLAVFLPPFLLLLAAVIFSFLDQEAFTTLATVAFHWVRDTFARPFTFGASLMLAVCVAVYLSPFGRVRIGGPQAKPLLSKWRLFSISLCTGIGVGILLFGAGEPISHLSSPPRNWGLRPNTAEAARMAMSAVYLHWTFIPYAMYTVVGVMFAFAYYNMGQPFSLGSPLWPILHDRCRGIVGYCIDAICLYSLVAGLAASLGGGLLLLTRGVHHLLGVQQTPQLLALILLVTVGTYTLSAVSGVMKGIRILSAINTTIFIGLMVFVLATGPTWYILTFGAETFCSYLKDLPRTILLSVTTAPDAWTKEWTVFYWAWWFTWTPMVGVFIGRISYGYTVRQFMVFNLVLPAVFGAVWMAVFGGTAIHMELHQDLGLVDALKDGGVEAVTYVLLYHLPLAQLMVPVFLLSVFLSFVTAADSNTAAMSSLSSTGISPESPEPSTAVKVIWGAITGLVAWIMVGGAGTDGMRMISNLGGLPALVLCLAVAWALIRVALKPMQYDRFKDGYDATGRPKKPTRHPASQQCNS